MRTAITDAERQARADRWNAVGDQLAAEIIAERRRAFRISRRRPRTETQRDYDDYRQEMELGGGRL